VIIVAGSPLVDEVDRESYLAGCVPAVAAAREAPGCLDFALSADLLDASRSNVFERRRSWDDLLRFL
jgi:quinol monooxygenase YgiN